LRPKNQTYAAVNGGPFQPYRIFSGQGIDPVGLIIWQGQLLSPARPGWSAFVTLPDFTVSVCYQEEAPAEAVYALGGFQKLLTKGEINDLAESPHRPRTVLGLSGDGRILWLLVADGDRPEYSRGLTTRESAEWLRALGAVEGMNLDGGGSSALVLHDQSGSSRAAKLRLRLINRPSNRRTPSLGYSERLVATHLGLRPRTSPNPPDDPL
jgi:exopolysaccharide biosynthesis protein